MDLGPLRPYTWAVLLGVFVPVSWILDVVLGPGVVVFAVAGIAIVPLAWFLGLATEELGKHAGPGVGGLLNATFGNATELIIAVFALASGLTEVVKASLTGSIIGNALLVLGLSMLAGGLRHKVQLFSREASGMQVTMLVVAVIGLVMPALYVLSPKIPSPVALQEMSLGIAGILLLAYVLGLIFSLRTHRDIFNPVTEVAEKARWERRFALAVLVVSTLVCLSVMAVRIMTLDFEIFELAALALSIAVVAAVVSDGRSNWYEGALLVIVYAVIAVAFLFHPP